MHMTISVRTLELLSEFPPALGSRALTEWRLGELARAECFWRGTWRPGVSQPREPPLEFGAAYVVRWGGRATRTRIMYDHSVRSPMRLTREVSNAIVDRL